MMKIITFSKLCADNDEAKAPKEMTKYPNGICEYRLGT